MTSLEKRKKELKKKKLLLAIWIVFLLVAGTCITLYITNFNKIKEAVGEKKRVEKIYETNADLEINVLVTTYLNAVTSCDQKTLKSLVTNPSQFDNMTVLLSRAQTILGYSHIDCYTIKGINENEYLCYVIANISLKDVKSTPKDIMVYYIVKNGDEYLIRNDIDSDIQNFIDQKTLHEDVQELYRIVKEDEDKCYNEDKTLRDFYDKVNGK